MINPELPAAKRCLEGLQAEGSGDSAKAKRCFLEAWDASETPYERAISAHYLARHQPNAEEELVWNKTALANALEAGTDAEEFLPSLLGCVALSCEKLSSSAEAMHYFHQAQEHLSCLPDNAYGELVRSMVSKGLARLNS